MHSFEELQDIFRKSLDNLNFDHEPRELYQPFDYILRLKGKRIRPVLLLMGAELFGYDLPLPLPQAIAIELFHNFTLIHDDIMDRAPLRRGVPAVHEKFNMPVAILSGDAMLIYAYMYLMQSTASFQPELLMLFNDCAIKVCEGQQMDMNFEKMDNPGVAGYLEMIELKTASLLATSLKIGGIMGGASQTDASHLYDFGRLLGISFQLKDDWLDSFGKKESTGKQSGGDIIQNKKTFLFLKALELGSPADRVELLQYYRDNAGAADKVNAVLQVFNRLKIDEVTHVETERFFVEACAHLDAISVPASRKEVLRNLASNLLMRES
jgi:geranylgeranyl diphosphate synthase type II